MWRSDDGDVRLDGAATRLWRAATRLADAPSAIERALGEADSPSFDIGGVGAEAILRLGAASSSDRGVLRPPCLARRGAGTGQRSGGHDRRSAPSNALVETSLDGRVIGRSALSLGGEVRTVVEPGAPADHARRHADAVGLTVATRAVVVRVAAVVFVGVAAVAARLVLPGGPIVALPAVWRFANRLVAEASSASAVPSGATVNEYADLEIGVHRRAQHWSVELRFKNPKSDADVQLEGDGSAAST